jgi:CDP-6-deoxy-D-xylo-4-hexulose-3-dehydrase
VNPILQFGAIPVFVDVEFGTDNVDASKIEVATTPKTKAIMLAHTLGNPYNLSVVTALCKQYNLWLVEDCCDALGATYGGQCVGTFGDIGTLGFYPAHLTSRRARVRRYSPTMLSSKSLLSRFVIGAHSGHGGHLNR